MVSSDQQGLHRAEYILTFSLITLIKKINCLKIFEKEFSNYTTKPKPKTKIYFVKKYVQLSLLITHEKCTKNWKKKSNPFLTKLLLGSLQAWDSCFVQAHRSYSSFWRSGRPGQTMFPSSKLQKVIVAASFSYKIRLGLMAKISLNSYISLLCLIGDHKDNYDNR